MTPNVYHIPKPCHEDWDQMSPTEKGAFCGSCKKEVLDFTDSSNSDIRVALTSATNPCVRIDSQKLDELNFLEWFNYLSLRKQLKYAFLFACFIVFNFTSFSQDTLVQPQRIELDWVDQTTFSQIVEEENYYEEESDYMALKKMDIIWVFPSDGIHLGMMWGPMMGCVAVDLKPYEIPFTEVANVNDNLYTFQIQEDSLLMSINSLFDQEIKLHISKDPIGVNLYPFKSNVVYLPILVRKGQYEYSIPLHQFANGSYTIRIESNSKEAVARINYW